MIANCTPPPANVQANAEILTALTLCWAEIRASEMTRSDSRASALLDLTVRIARRVPSRIPPRRPTASWDCRCATAIGGIRRANNTAIAMMAEAIAPSITRSSTAMRIRAPTRPTTLLTMATNAFEVASRSRTVSEVTRVTSSPVGRVPRLPTVAPKYLRTMDLRASRTTRSARTPSTIHCRYSTSEPTTSRATRISTGWIKEASVPRPSSTPLATIGVASAAPVPMRPRVRPSDRVRRCGRTNCHSTRRFGTVIFFFSAVAICTSTMAPVCRM